MLRYRLGGVLAAVSALIVSSTAFADTGPCDAPTCPAQYPDKFDWNGGSSLVGDLFSMTCCTKGTEAGITLCSQYNPMPTTSGLWNMVDFNATRRVQKSQNISNK
jgi:hypothetical protein